MSNKQQEDLTTFAKIVSEIESGLGRKFDKEEREAFVIGFMAGAKYEVRANRP